MCVLSCLLRPSFIPKLVKQDNQSFVYFDFVIFYITSVMMYVSICAQMKVGKLEMLEHDSSLPSTFSN